MIWMKLYLDLLRYLHLLLQVIAVASNRQVIPVIPIPHQNLSPVASVPPWNQMMTLNQRKKRHSDESSSGVATVRSIGAN